MRSTTRKVGNYEREAARSEYASLLRSTLPAVIRSAAENEDPIARLEELDREGSRMSAAERRLAELLPLLVEDCTESFFKSRCDTCSRRPFDDTNLYDPSAEVPGANSAVGFARTFAGSANWGLRFRSDRPLLSLSLRSALRKTQLICIRVASDCWWVEGAEWRCVDFELGWSCAGMRSCGGHGR
jgi:hypothetical protein